MKFRYRKISPQPPSDFFGKHIHRPIIPVTISSQGKAIIYAALIDSGADFCIFDAEIGEYLGLNIKTGMQIEFGGIQQSSTGRAKAYIHTVVLEVGGIKTKTEVAFSYDISKNGCGILGQKGFFDRFSIKFDLIKEDIELKEK